MIFKYKYVPHVLWDINTLKELFVVYLAFKFNLAFCILSDGPGRRVSGSLVLKSPRLACGRRRHSLC